MAKKSIKPVCSGPDAKAAVGPVVVTPESITEAERLAIATIGPGELVYVTPTPAERDLNTLIEAQKIRRDPARFMAAKALPQAQKHYIV